MKRRITSLTLTLVLLVSMCFSGVIAVNAADVSENGFLLFEDECAEQGKRVKNKSNGISFVPGQHGSNTIFTTTGRIGFNSSGDYVVYDVSGLSAEKIVIDDYGNNSVTFKLEGYGEIQSDWNTAGTNITCTVEKTDDIYSIDGKKHAWQKRTRVATLGENCKYVKLTAEWNITDTNQLYIDTIRVYGKKPVAMVFEDGTVELEADKGEATVTVAATVGADTCTKVEFFDNEGTPVEGTKGTDGVYTADLTMETGAHRVYAKAYFGDSAVVSDAVVYSVGSSYKKGESMTTYDAKSGFSGELSTYGKTVSSDSAGVSYTEPALQEDGSILVTNIKGGFAFDTKQQQCSDFEFSFKINSNYKTNLITTVYGNSDADTWPSSYITMVSGAGTTKKSVRVSSNGNWNDNKFVVIGENVLEPGKDHVITSRVNKTDLNHGVITLFVDGKYIGKQTIDRTDGAGSDQAFNKIIKQIQVKGAANTSESEIYIKSFECYKLIENDARVTDLKVNGESDAYAATDSKSITIMTDKALASGSKLMIGSQEVDLTISGTTATADLSETTLQPNTKYDLKIGNISAGSIKTAAAESSVREANVSMSEGKCVATMKYSNTTNSADSVTMILGLYDESKEPVGFATHEHAIQAFEVEGSGKSEIALPDGFKGTAKLFCWDSLNGAVPRFDIESATIN